MQDESPMDPTMEGMEMQDEGFGGSLSDVAGATARLAPVPLAIFALVWVSLATLRRRGSVPRSITASPPLAWRGAAIGALLASALLHAGLTPEHFQEIAAYGVFFAAATVALVGAAAAVLAWPSRPVYLGGVALSLALIALYVLFRLVPPPGAAAPEEVDLVGLLTKGTEVVAAVACGALWAWSGRVERRQVAA